MVFFAVFLFECSQPLAKSKRPRGSQEIEASRSGRFGDRPPLSRAPRTADGGVPLCTSSARRRCLLIAAALLSIPIAAHGQRTQPPAPPPSDTDQPISPAVQKQLDAMQKRIDQLEAELNSRTPRDSRPQEEMPHLCMPWLSKPSGSQAPASRGCDAKAAAPGKPAKPEPFSFADFTWLNGNSRVKEVPFQNAFFTPEIRADISYIYDFAHPQDDTIGGSSEVFRSSEFQVTQARRWWRLPLGQCSGAGHDAVRHVFPDHAAQ